MTLNGKYCFDISCVIDFLIEHIDFVDEHNIALMGHSLGGQMSIYGAIYDARVKVVVCSCGFGKIGGKGSIVEAQIPHNFAMYLPNLLDSNVGIDMKEIVGLIAPRPLVISSGKQDDIFPGKYISEN